MKPGSGMLSLIACIALVLAACSGAGPEEVSTASTAAATPVAAGGAALAAGVRPASAPALYLRRVTEPRESAFVMLVPDGWQFEGGVLRMNPLAGAGPVNTVSAKFDFLVRKDQQGSVLMHWIPGITYKDSRRMAFGGAGFPTGSTYMGMTVHPVMDPESFLLKVVFPREHPRARDLEIVERQPLPELVQAYERVAPSMPGLGTYRYDAIALTVRYSEDSTGYREKLMTLIEDSGDLGVGMWSNKETTIVRAPDAEFDRLKSLFAAIQGSIAPDPAWLAGERMGAARRARMALDTQRYIQDVDRQIVDHRRRTNAEIAHRLWLNMSGQEDYINPHTGEIEYGSDRWKHRWQCGNGDVIYSDDPNYDPAWDPQAKRKDFKRSPARVR
jgi:hypothetical protein